MLFKMFLKEFKELKLLKHLFSLQIYSVILFISCWILEWDVRKLSDAKNLFHKKQEGIFILKCNSK